ncbi:MAG: hypothetical protein K0B87_04825 [Candidatus Syntrophosphaera sp.]|nr:hypothetical protein [Candidatus Syntrophosphaera sp.]
MLKIEPSLHPIWTDFSLRIETCLEFTAGASYHLSGANGSGKSSFITQLLLPRLLAQPDIYTLYFEQQMHHQIQTTKAYASLIKPHAEIKTEKDTVDFLLDNLCMAVEAENRPCCIVLDESLFQLQISDFLAGHISSYCLIHASHADPVPDTRRVVFEPVSASLSKVYATPV